MRQCCSLLVLPAALAGACGVQQLLKVLFAPPLLMVLPARVRNALWPPASFILCPDGFVLLLCNVYMAEALVLPTPLALPLALRKQNAQDPPSSSTSHGFYPPIFFTLKVKKC